MARIFLPVNVEGSVDPKQKSVGQSAILESSKQPEKLEFGISVPEILVLG